MTEKLRCYQGDIKKTAARGWKYTENICGKVCSKDIEKGKHDSTLNFSF